jgi:hypothetical protein
MWLNHQNNTRSSEAKPDSFKFNRRMKKKKSIPFVFPALRRVVDM